MYKDLKANVYIIWNWFFYKLNAITLIANVKSIFKISEFQNL